MNIPRGFKTASSKEKISPGSSWFDVSAWFSRTRCAAAGVFTRNRVQSAPIKVSRKHINSGYAQAILVNAGCANAGTGTPGIRDAQMTARLLARAVHISPYDILLASTGVIGTRLNMKAMNNAINSIAEKIKKHGSRPSNFRLSAKAIMTTDTFPKALSRKISFNNHHITIWACAKGAGMIHPNMATMLAVFLTDARISPPVAQKLLGDIVDVSFNRVSVDGDTSTNDTVYLLANGCSESPFVKPGKPGWSAFRDAFTGMSVELARMIASDGEGAKHLITIHVEKARNKTQALSVARTVATSPLVKTAVYGMDPNWGRILAAVGRSDGSVNPDKITIFIGKYKVCHNGRQCLYPEHELRKILKRNTVDIRILLHQGQDAVEFWTCDLTEKYIHINAHYRT